MQVKTSRFPIVHGACPRIRHLLVTVKQPDPPLMSLICWEDLTNFLWLLTSRGASKLRSVGSFFTIRFFYFVLFSIELREEQNTRNNLLGFPIYTRLSANLRTFFVDVLLLYRKRRFFCTRRHGFWWLDFELRLELLEPVYPISYSMFDLSSHSSSLSKKRSRDIWSHQFSTSALFMDFSLQIN